MFVLKRRKLDNAPFLVYLAPGGNSYMLKDRHSGRSTIYSKKTDPDMNVILNGIQSFFGTNYATERTHLLISVMAGIMEDVTGKPVESDYSNGLLTASINIDHKIYGEMIMHKRDSQAVFRIAHYERSVFVSNKLDTADIMAITNILTELLTDERIKNNGIICELSSTD